MKSGIHPDCCSSKYMTVCKSKEIKMGFIHAASLLKRDNKIFLGIRYVLKFV